MDAERTGWRAVLHAPVFSPQGFLARAALIVFVFLLCHLVGLREHTSIICGTSPSGDTADRWSAALGVLYALFWFAFVLGVPILVLAAGVFAALLKLRPGRAARSNAEGQAGEAALSADSGAAPAQKA